MKGLAEESRARHFSRALLRLSPPEGSGSMVEPASPRRFRGDRPVRGGAGLA
jgi:hypothetical protein